MRHMSRKPKAENRELRTDNRKATEPGLLIRVCKSTEGWSGGLLLLPGHRWQSSQSYVDCLLRALVCESDSERKKAVHLFAKQQQNYVIKCFCVRC